jgi:predicted dehydrogenase
VSRNIALIGCGAIARAFYLPALAKHRTEFDRLWLVDPSDHAVSIATSIVTGQRARHLTDVDDEIHLAIVATPNQLHFPVAHEALSRGAHVLVEKPFVVHPAEGRQLIAAATAGNRVIAVNQTRRFFPLARELRRRISEGEFGSLRSIVHREGTKLTWPFESGAAFARGAQRTGVIMDFGVHVIDFYHYLLQPKWRLVSAVHDGFCGPEGLTDIALQANDARVAIFLSRYYPQDNIARLEFEHAEVAFNVYDDGAYSVRANGGKVTHCVSASVGAEYGSYAPALLLNFLAASEKRESAVCDAASSLPVIDLLDEIYKLAQQYPGDLGAI